ncbi:hypothetical protein SAMN04515667_1797 [Formosa sp. Hel1_31_208]|uniref:Smr/MutS family protein n=1 Tax=Formosa sp. Hel1_31_208 TaxID=1798225 RepID=UPI00087ABD3E|nr:Smr/MutS family protein [Formosa sp. Hel1_31_208]SDS27141.1 hypothetical protein SAMN04515667_1797 [Formosa sp. Hel1_31_208]
MSFSIGDIVSVLDEAINGRVTNIAGHTITIETDEGFEMEFKSSEIIKTNSLSPKLFSNIDVTTVIKEKEQSQKRKSVKVKPKERNLPMMEVDLHIHHLTSSYKRMSNFDMLNLQMDTAKRKLDFAIKKRISKIVFIHGVGEGVLKTELEYLFGRYENIKHSPADYQKYGLGATEVYILQNKPS